MRTPAHSGSGISREMRRGREPARKKEKTMTESILSKALWIARSGRKNETTERRER